VRYAWFLFRRWHVKKEEIEAFFFNTIAQFTNARSVHSAFYPVKNDR
jgi:hypothetical protein